MSLRICAMLIAFGFVGVMTLLGCLTDISQPFLPIEVDKQVELTIDLTQQRYIGGISALERQDYFILHNNGNLPPERPQTSHADLEKLYIEELDLHFGKLTAYGWHAGRITEDPERPGYGDPEYFNSLPGPIGAFSDFQWKYRDRYEYVITGGVRVPDFMVDDGGILPKDFDAYADYMAMYFQSFAPEAFPLYYEVWNEIEVKRWDGSFTWDDISQLHIAVAERIKQDYPELKVGGPTAAWPRFPNNDFGNWQGFASFFAQAGPHLDFLSSHFYDPRYPEDFSDDYYSVDRFLSSVERIGAKLDLIESYSLAALGEVLPFVISEYGGLYPGPHVPLQVSYWYRLNSVNNYVMKFMERPDRIVKSVPFICGYTAWNPEYPAAMLRDQGTHYKVNEQSHFYRLWAGVKGDRMSLTVSDPSLRSVVFQDRDVVYLGLKNLQLDVMQVDINTILPTGIAITEASISRSFFDKENEVPKLDLNQPLTDYKTVILDSHEAAIVRL